MKKTPELISKEQFEKVCQEEIPKKGFCLVGIEYIDGNPKHPAIFIKEIHAKTLPKARIASLELVVYGFVKTSFNEPLCLFKDGKLEKNFTNK